MKPSPNAAHIGICVSLAVAALVMPAHHPARLRIVYNASDSVARGWYRVQAQDVMRLGDLVLAPLPDEVTTLAAQRGYLPLGVPILKPIAAMAPQLVCADEHQVVIDDGEAVMALTTDSRQRALPHWQQCRRLLDGELFLLSRTNRASFDSRYFGPLNVNAVIGVAHPLWTWETP